MSRDLPSARPEARGVWSGEVVCGAPKGEQAEFQRSRGFASCEP